MFKTGDLVWLRDEYGKRFVGGVVVQNATLHNEDYIAGRDASGQPIRGGRDIRPGDRVMVYRAGDVIPKIADVDLADRPEGAAPYAFPTRCPACGAESFQKQLTAAGFQLKGSGWYATDFKGGSSAAKPAETKSDAPAAAPASDSGSTTASSTPAAGCGGSCACH